MMTETFSVPSLFVLGLDYTKLSAPELRTYLYLCSHGYTHPGRPCILLSNLLSPTDSLPEGVGLDEPFEPDYTVVYDTLYSLQDKGLIVLRPMVKAGFEIVIVEPGTNTRSEAHPPIVCIS